MTTNRATPDLRANWRFEIDAVGAGDCAWDAEPFALLVVGASMRPEFEDGDVIIVEPGALTKDGSFVVALSDGQWLLRQLRRQGEGWMLSALNCDFPSVRLPDLVQIRGVVIQKSRPGRRSATRHYLA